MTAPEVTAPPAVRAAYWRSMAVWAFDRARIWRDAGDEVIAYQWARTGHALEARAVRLEAQP